MTQMRAYFFDAPATTSGDRFVQNNIPSQTTYQKLIDSVAFLSEPSDQATINRQGLVKVYTHDEAISARNSPVVVAGERKVMAADHPPGTGVLDGVYKESTPSVTSNGTKVAGKGIAVTGVIYQSGQMKRIGHQVELDIESLPLFSNPDNTFLLPVMDIAGKHYKAPYGASSLGPTGTLSYTHPQDLAATIWTVQHNMGYKPNISIEVDSVIVEAKVEHIDVNNVRVTFSQLKKGKVYCS